MILDVKNGFYGTTVGSFELICSFNSYFNTSHFDIKLEDEENVLKVAAKQNY